MYSLERGSGTAMELGAPDQPDRPVDGVARERVGEAIAAARRVVDEAGGGSLVQRIEQVVGPSSSSSTETSNDSPSTDAAVNASALPRESRATRASTTSLTLSGTSPAASRRSAR